MFKNAKWITGYSFYNMEVPDIRNRYTLPTDGSFYMRKEFSLDKKVKCFMVKNSKVLALSLKN